MEKIYIKLNLTSGKHPGEGYQGAGDTRRRNESVSHEIRGAQLIKSPYNLSFFGWSFKPHNPPEFYNLQDTGFRNQTPHKTLKTFKLL